MTIRIKESEIVHGTAEELISELIDTTHTDIFHDQEEGEKAIEILGNFEEMEKVFALLFNAAK